MRKGRIGPELLSERLFFILCLMAKGLSFLSMTELWFFEVYLSNT